MKMNSELAAEFEDAYFIRHMTDGTTTLVQIVNRDVYGDGPKVIGQGVSRRRKGDPRNRQLGSALAFVRAHQEAVEYYKQSAYEAEHGTLAMQMRATEVKVLSQQYKEKARKVKDARRAAARARFERSGGLARLMRLGWKK